MPAPTASILDNFNRANAKPPSSSYTLGPIVFTAGNELAIESNVLRKSNASGGNGENNVYYNVTDYGPDVEVVAKIADVATLSSDLLRLYARINSPGSGTTVAYCLRVSHDGTGFRAWRCQRRDAPSTFTAIGSDQIQTVAIGDLVGFNVTGTGATVTIQFWYKASGGSWTQIGSDFTDTSGSRIVSAGKIGAGIIGFGAALDDLSVQTLTSGTVFTQALTATQGQAASLPKTPGKVLIP